MNGYTSLFETTYNTRELGGYTCVDGKVTRPWRILRSDVQTQPSERDIELLQSHKITTVIDMRDDRAVLRSPSGFAALEGFHYHRCPIIEGAAIPASRELVPVTYMNMAESEGAGLAFRAIANAPDGVIINCTAGKDRTGVISAILLMLAGVSKEDVIENYILTKDCAWERIKLIHEHHPDADMSIVIPCRMFIETFLDRFAEKYISAYDYLLGKGLTEKEAESIRNKLVCRNQ